MAIRISIALPRNHPSTYDTGVGGVGKFKTDLKPNGGGGVTPKVKNSEAIFGLVCIVEAQ